MSGFYNNWVKVYNPHLSNDIIQMRSNGFQAPFYFGGSQVPINLHLNHDLHSISGEGIRDYKKTDFLQNEKGIKRQKTTINRQNNIYMPRRIGSLSLPSN